MLPALSHALKHIPSGEVCIKKAPAACDKLMHLHVSRLISIDLPFRTVCGTVYCNMDAHMVHGNAHDDRPCGPVPAQTPTMSAHIMEVKHTRPGLAILHTSRGRAVGELGRAWPTTACDRGSHSTHQRPLSRFSEAAAMSPAAPGRPSGRCRSCSGCFLPQTQAAGGQCSGCDNSVETRSRSGAAHLQMVTRSKASRPSTFLQRSHHIRSRTCYGNRAARAAE